MAETNCQISFGLFDISAKPDAKYRSIYTMWVSDYNSLKIDGFQIPFISTLEPQQTLLNGKFNTFKVGNGNTGWWSHIFSNKNKQFGYDLGIEVYSWDFLDSTDYTWDMFERLGWSWNDLWENYDTWDTFERLKYSWDDCDILSLSMNQLGPYYKGNVKTPVPYLEINFSENHSSTGLTLRFAEKLEEWPTKINIKWYDDNDEVVGYGDFEPISATFFAERPVVNYRKIIISFYETNKPYRTVKLSGIDFGILQTLSGTDIISAKIHEEISGISAQTMVNTLSCQLYSDVGNFYLMNSRGAFAFLQERQKLIVEETLNGEKVPMGTFYLTAPKSPSRNISTIDAVDLMGVIDRTQFMGGMYENILSEDLIRIVLTSAGAGYRLDNSLKGIKLSGHIPVCSHREALQQVVFAIGGIATCARTDIITIKAIDEVTTDQVLTKDRYYRSPVELQDLITGVDVVAHRYIKNNEVQELLSEELVEGEYTINFNDPVHSLSIQGGKILSWNVNLARIQVPTNSLVVLTGKGYTHNTQTFSKRLRDVPSSTADNIREVTNATLVSSSIAKDVLERVFRYFQYRYVDTFAYITTDQVADVVMTNQKDGGQIRGIVESMDIDLVGGFLSTTKVVGKLLDYGSYDYTTEIYTDDAIGVI